MAFNIVTVAFTTIAMVGVEPTIQRGIGLFCTNPMFIAHQIGPSLSFLLYNCLGKNMLYLDKITTLKRLH